MHKRSAVVPSAAARVADTEAVPRPEDLFPIVEIPNRLPPRPSGRRLHPKVALRWTIRGSHGVMLRHVAVGRQKCTTWGWVMEFLGAVAEAMRLRRQQTTVRPPNANPTKPAKTAGRSAARAARTKHLLAHEGLDGGVNA